jgi:flavin reductase (DIM6/NTAB) family NADH-FMN oxidoreductase RutF
MAKTSYPLTAVYGLLEPGPVVLLTTLRNEQPNVMPLSWHSMLEFEPPLIACVVSNRNYSYQSLLDGRECVINIPTIDIADKVVACGNCSGATENKFQRFSLTPQPSEVVSPPGIAECFANLECRLVDDSMVPAYGLFVLEVVAARCEENASTAKTLHHQGWGQFMVAGQRIRLTSAMR